MIEQVKIKAENDSLPDETSVDLEKAAEDYEHRLGYYECLNQWPSVAFIAGAKWQKEQMPMEWSEEDEDMLNSCISSIEEAKENRYAYKETDGDTSYDYEIAWLKSLRPVSKESLQPHWNPSKEQMDALKDVAYGTYQNGNGPALRSLYEQLKKLGVKEEPEYYQHFDPNC